MQHEILHFLFISDETARLMFIVSVGCNELVLSSPVSKLVSLPLIIEWMVQAWMDIYAPLSFFVRSVDFMIKNNSSKLAESEFIVWYHYEICDPSHQIGYE